jgi:hypothetical protein
MHLTKVENAFDLRALMIGRYHLVEIKGIKDLAVLACQPTHHRPLPPPQPTR